MKRNIFFVSCFLFFFLFNISCQKDDIRNNSNKNEKVNPTKNVYCIDRFIFTYVKDRKINTFPNGVNAGNTFTNTNSANVFVGTSNNCVAGTWISSQVFCNNLHDIFTFYANGTGSAVLIGIVQGECIPHYATFTWKIEVGKLKLHIYIPDMQIEADVEGLFNCSSTSVVLNGLTIIRQ